MDDVTVEQIKTQIKRFASSASITLPARQLMPLLTLAMKKIHKDSGTISQLSRAARGVEVRLSGEEIRMILEYALHAKVAENPRRPSLRVVPPSTKKD